MMILMTSVVKHPFQVHISTEILSHLELIKRNHVHAEDVRSCCIVVNILLECATVHTLSVKDGVSHA